MHLTNYKTQCQYAVSRSLPQVQALKMLNRKVLKKIIVDAHQHVGLLQEANSDLHLVTKRLNRHFVPSFLCVIYLFCSF